MSVASTGAPSGVSPLFWRLLLDDVRTDSVVVDVGTGDGRIAIPLASHCSLVVGVDREADVIDEARQRAVKLGVANVEFVVADADGVGYRALVSRVPDIVTAHLFLSDQLVERAAAVLAPGGALVVLGFHVDQWKETGRASRFAYDEARMRALLERCGFVVERLSVERDVQTFGSVEEALAAAIGLHEKWRADGRWFRYIKFLEDGGRTLTRSHLIARARKA
jgi:ubiquinone/menaquinone biosynthesis C-methylase UbiE